MPGKDTISIAEDDRAKIPFAVIGVLLLVTSVSIVVVLETRSEPEVDTDAAQSYDRTSSAVRSVLQGATAEALQDAAEQPVTAPDTSTSVGQALATGPSGGPDSDEVFSRYVQLRVYLALQERIGHANQSIRQDTVTRVSMPQYDDPSDAIDAITLQVGGEELDYGDPGGSDLPHGSVRVTVPDVQIEVVEDGHVVGTRTQDYTVTVGSSVFELHHRTETYEAALNTDLGDDSGFSRHFAARLYRLGWQRGHAQASGAPVAEVLADRHLRTIANDAVFATQRDAFGADDPYSNRTLARSYACMLAEDHHAIYDDPTGGSPDLGPALDAVDDPGFCDGASNTYADLGGGLEGAAAPDYRAIAGPNDYLEGTEQLDLASTANASLGGLTTAGGIEAAIRRAYAVNVTVDDAIDRTIPIGDPDADNTELYSYDVTVQEPEQLLAPDASGRLREYYRFHVIFTGWFERGGMPTQVRYDVNLTVRGEHSPRQWTEERGLDLDYEQGPRGSSDALYGTNYVGVPSMAVEASLAGVDDASRAADQLEAYLQNNADGVLDGEDVVDVATVDGGNVTVHQTPSNPDALRAWLFEDLRSLQEDVSGVSETYARHELLNGTGPIDAMADDVADDGPWVYEHVGDGQYRNVPDLARAEVRLDFMRRVRDRVNRSANRHDQTLDAFDRQLAAHDTGANLSEATGIARRQLSASPYTPAGNRTDHEILENVSITPDGEPTFLTLERVNASQVPAIGDPPAGFAPVAERHENVYAAPYDYRLPGNASTSNVHLRTAGEVLRAGHAAADVRSSGWAAGEVAALESAVDAELEDVVDHTAAAAARPFPTLDRADLEPAIRAEIAALGPIERRAISLTSGDRTLERVADGVAARFEDGDHPDYRYWRGDRHVHLSTAVRAGLHDALGEGFVDRSTAADARSLAGSIRTEVDDEDAVARSERRARAGGGSLADDATTPTGAAWLQSNVSGGEYAPNTVSAGIDTTNLPEWDLLTTNLWTIHLEGEYARFQVRSSSAEPTDDPTAYVREDDTVRLTYDGREQVAGRTEAIRFESDTALVVAVPPDSLGVGDRTDTIVECSDTYPDRGSVPPVGPVGGRCAVP